jgi:guanosine-3',5'-bis(diphosphate) 3'-pyrophosphohydrolase
MTQFLSKNLLKALKFASQAHADQKRKDQARTPYISHPAAVGYILLQSGAPEEVVIAGILHDVIEDTAFTYDDIVSRFGEKVAELVQEVSEDTSLSYDARKDGYLNKLETDSPEACLISAADLLANQTDMLSNFDDGEDLWFRPPYNMDIERKLARDIRRIEIIKSKTSVPFIEELEETVSKVHQKFINK